MTNLGPVPNEKKPVELKVKMTTLAAVLVGAVLAALNNTTADNELLGSAPPWLQAVVLIAGPGAVTFLTGWSAKHTYRADQGNQVTRTG
jgi:hypothetical protein